MTHYRAQPEDDPVLIVLCAVRDGQFGKSALNEVIDLWVAGQIGRTDEVAVQERLRAGPPAMSHEDYETEPVDPTLVTAADYETYVRPYIAALQAEVERLADQLREAVDERDRLREVLRAVLIEPDPIKRNQLAAPVLRGAVAR
jgi:hypothetical protein